MNEIRQDIEAMLDTVRSEYILRGIRDVLRKILHHYMGGGKS